MHNNEITNIYLSQMQNLTDTLQQLSDANIDTISVMGLVTSPAHFEIQVYPDANFNEWVKQYQWAIVDRPDETYPRQIEAIANGCKVYALCKAQDDSEWEKWMVRK